VIAELMTLESLALYSAWDEHDGPPGQLDDNALSAIADLPALADLSLLGGSYSEHGLQQRFAAAMPALTQLTGLDEFGDDGPMPPAEVDKVRAMLPPHICMD
jgi:hypothetical protein